MDNGTRRPPLPFSHRYQNTREKMPYYAYHCKPLGPPLPPFVKKRLPKYGSQYMSFYGTKYIPPHGRETWRTPFSLARGAGYQPRTIPVGPEIRGTMFLKRNPTVRPYKNEYQYPLEAKVPYDGTTKGPHGPINHSLPCVASVPLPRVAKGPVLYSTKDLHPSLTRIPLPRASKGPVCYAAEDPFPSSTREAIPQMSKGPRQNPLKATQFPAARQSRLPETMSSPQPGPKGTQPRATKSPRFLATKVPRFSGLTTSRSFLKRGARSFLTKSSQSNLGKGSRSSLSKTSRVSLAKSSQPSLATYPPPKKLSKNVKIASNGKKYCSATKWPF